MKAFLVDALEIRRRVLLAFEAAEREEDGAEQGALLSFVVIGGSMVVDFFRARVLYRVAAETGSEALEADALHFGSDLWSSVAVLIVTPNGYPPLEHFSAAARK